MMQYDGKKWVKFVSVQKTKQKQQKQKENRNLFWATLSRVISPSSNP